MRVTFFGGAKSVTGAAYLVEAAGKRVLVDCGLFQGGRFSEEKNFAPFPFDPETIDAVAVTHAHLDHTGRIPKLYREGFRGRIFSTAPTKEFADLILEDSTDVLIREAAGMRQKPLWTHDDHWGAMRLWEDIEYRKPVEVAPGFTLTFFDAGHILGSAFIAVAAEGKTIAFSGDLGNPPVVMLNPPDPLPEISAAIVESTYGNRIHEPPAARRELLEDVIEETVSAGGVLMIPAFAIERTQELLFELNALVEEGRVPKVPIFLDSPLAIKATAIYKKYAPFMSEGARRILTSGDEIFQFPGLSLTLTTEESKAINDVPASKIVIAGAGMSNGGRILHHERRYLSDPKSTILMVGYQSKGTLGRRILDGEKSVRIFDERVAVKCRVQFLGGFSAHADQAQMLAWLWPQRERLSRVFLVQGEEEAMKGLAAAIRDRLAVETGIPDEGTAEGV